MNKLFIAFLILAVSGISNLQAQDKRAPSPAATVTQRVGLTDITIEYSRPSMKERKIFAADGLVPFGKVWRTGANAATKMTISDALKFGDDELAAGSYAIVTTPNESSWDIHFITFKEAGVGPYLSAKPTLTVKADANTGDVEIESFMIMIDGLRDYSAALVMGWENTVVALPFTVN